jgi:hypothetical protein
MQSIGLWFFSGGQINILGGIFGIVALIVLCGHKWITAYAELRKTRKDKSDDD